MIHRRGVAADDAANVTTGRHGRLSLLLIGRSIASREAGSVSDDLLMWLVVWSIVFCWPRLAERKRPGHFMGQSRG